MRVTLGHHTRRTVAAALAAAALTGGCQAEPPEPTAGSTPAGDSSPAPSDPASDSPGGSAAEGPPVLQPGRPGEPNATVAPEDVPSTSEWSHADEMFAQMMVVHHAQALEMSTLAMRHADDPAVESLARRIHGAQGPEIVEMAGWLSARGLRVPTTEDDPAEFDHGTHGHTPMTGMLTEEEMAALAAARGRRFDVLFLEGMIKHHEGALTMADVVAVDGADVRIGELAADIVASQTAEIGIMRQMLDRLEG